MSMPGLPQGRGEVGETVAGFPTYEGAQKAVSQLIAADIPAREIAIVGIGLRSVERVTGRLGYATAARSGAINGLLLGLFFSAIFLLGNSAAPVSVFIGVLFLGVAVGMLMSIAAYAIVRRRRDFASVMQVIADRYEVTVLSGSIHRAREVLGAAPTAAASSHPEPVRPEPARPAPGTRPSTDAPPRYGERIEPERPAYGELAPDDSTAPSEAESAEAEAEAGADGPESSTEAPDASDHEPESGGEAEDPVSGHDDHPSRGDR